MIKLYIMYIFNKGILVNVNKNYNCLNYLCCLGFERDLFF